MANGNPILPNYQVRYSLKDLELFKNSMVKNVALVDNELQGKQYTSNKGGSGFGKFRELPKPEIITWQTSNKLDVFVGKHNGFNNVGVDYSRQVIYVKNDFWIVKDNFSSEGSHTFKQVWQGHYSLENQPNLMRSTFSNGSGLDIFQLNTIDEISMDGARGKQWMVASKNNQQNFSFITVLYPFSTYDKRVNEDVNYPSFSGWNQLTETTNFKGKNAKILIKENEFMAFSVENLVFGDLEILFKSPADIYINKTEQNIQIQLLSELPVKINSKILQPGETITLSLEKY